MFTGFGNHHLKLPGGELYKKKEYFLPVTAEDFLIFIWLKKKQMCSLHLIRSPKQTSFPSMLPVISTQPSPVHLSTGPFPGQNPGPRKGGSRLHLPVK